MPGKPALPRKVRTETNGCEVLHRPNGPQCSTRSLRTIGDMAMRAMLSAYLIWLCEIFQVTPDSITRDRRGNMPPPSGGIAAF